MVIRFDWKAVFIFIIVCSLLSGLAIVNEWDMHYSITDLFNIMNMDTVAVNGTNVSTTIEPGISRTWSSVNSGLYVFSAFYTDKETCVQVVVLTEFNTSTFKCAFTDIKGTWLVDGTMKMDHKEHHNQTFRSKSIYCPLDPHKRPAIVKIIQTPSMNTSEALTINYPRARSYNFSVCIPPLYGSVKDISIIQMIETDLLLGVNHFTFYNYSLTAEVNNILEYYRKQGLLDVIPWNLPKVQVHYYGQMASIQDCILAYRSRSKFVILKDLDEFIVPHKHKNLSTMMDVLHKNGSKVGSYMFRNAFFDMKWAQDISDYKEASGAKKLNIPSLLYVWRIRDIWKTRIRSKLIVLPERVGVVGIHFAWKMRSGFSQATVDLDMSFLHHYRYWNGKGEKVKDVIFREYSSELINNINRTLIHSTDV